MNHPNDTIERILAGVCQTYGITRMQLVSKSRYREVVIARDAAVVALRRLTIYSTPEIAAVLGFNSHTNVLAALKRAEQYEAAAKAGLAEAPPTPEAPAVEMPITPGTTDHVAGAGNMVQPSRKRNVGKFLAMLRSRLNRRVVDA